MAANRFATVLNRNTNKITLILMYAILEWILILLLLFNSLFSYLIVKFAEFFGLKPPCPWCARLDHLFDHVKGGRSVNRDFLCEVHSKEISKLGFCSNHRKLVVSQRLCEGCSPETDFGLFGKMKEFGNLKEGVTENDEVRLNCYCCGVILGSNNDKYSSYILLKASSLDDVLECAQKQNLITESDVEKVKVLGFVPDLFDDENVLENKSDGQNFGNAEGPEENGFAYATVNGSRELEREKEILKDENLDLMPKYKSVKMCAEEDAPLDVSSEHLDFFVDYSGHKLVPVELIDSVTEERKIEEDFVAKDREVCVDSELEVLVKEEVLVVESGRKIEDKFLDFDMTEEPKYELLDSVDMEEDGNSLVFPAKGSHLETGEFEHFGVFSLAQWPSEEVGKVQEAEVKEKHSDVQTVCEEASHGNNENEGDISIGTEIPDLDITEAMQIQDSDLAYEPIREDPSTNSADLCAFNDHGPTQMEEQFAEIQSLSVHDQDNITNNAPSVKMQLEIQSLSVHNRDNITNNAPSVQMQLKEIEEDKVPDTPTSMESLNPDKNLLLLFEKRDCGIVESLDGSVTSELDGGDGVFTIEHLRSALRSERKALQALYTELEEERSASAVATNQTMAMINRLQEEKAAMQMEALQYQRMMEEQSEYDQESLQLLNELMVKREKEKHELERDLEVYKRKFSDYEIKEKTRAMKKGRNGSFRSGFSSASCSNAEDSDGLSVDLNPDAKEEDDIYGISDYKNQNTPVNAVVNLEESLVDFEEERLSILEHLKVLEEKLVMLDDENGQSFEDVKEMGENGVHFNGESNGYLNGKHHYRRVSGQKGRSLLPLFNAISDENGDLMIVNDNGVDHESYEPKFEMEGSKKIAVEEEMDHLYERLQALEGDREFLKHCTSSLKKGDKGMDLLQEIVQHLRDLRSVELRFRNFDDGAVI